MLTVNEYFEGKVKSIGLKAQGKKATIGVMEAGDYEFGTSTREVMQIVSGSMRVKLPGAADWVNFDTGSSFEVEAGKKFQLKLAQDSSYLCLYD